MWKWNIFTIIDCHWMFHGNLPKIKRLKFWVESAKQLHIIENNRYFYDTCSMCTNHHPFVGCSTHHFFHIRCAHSALSSPGRTRLRFRLAKTKLNIKYVHFAQNKQICLEYAPHSTTLSNDDDNLAITTILFESYESGNSKTVI